MSGDHPRGDLWAGVWRLADPKISLASIASMFVGACAAAREGTLAWGWLAAAASLRLLGSPEVTARIVPAQAWTLIAFLLYAAGAGAGLLLAPF